MSTDPPKHETYPFFTLSNTDSFGFGFSGSSEKPPPPPPPCVEVLLAEASRPIASNVDPIIITEGLTLLKGRASTNDVFGLSNSDLVPGMYEGGLKLWEGSVDLVKALVSEVEHDSFLFNRKRVLELGCGHGLPGIFACLKRADAVHFQDFNSEVLRCLTIPNVISNLPEDTFNQDSDRTEQAGGSLSPDVRFYAGDWREIHKLLKCECEDERYQVQEASLQQSCNGYDVILMAETFYSPSTIQNLFDLIKKCLNPSQGVVYLAGKKHYFGVGGGTRQFLNVVNEDGAMVSSLLAEVADGSSNVREVWKLSFKLNVVKENQD